MRRFAQAIQNSAQGAVNAVRQALRGVIQTLDSADSIQKAQVSGLADELLQEVEVVQQFGFTSHPPAGSQAVVIPIGGESSHSVVIGTENASFRIKGLGSGEVAIYDQSGSSIVLRAGRVVAIDCDTFTLNCNNFQVSASGGASFSTPNLSTSADFAAQGNISGKGGATQINGGGISTSGDVVADGTSLKGHVHSGDSGGTTSPPRGKG